MTKYITWTDVDALVRKEVAQRGIICPGIGDAETAYNFLGVLIATNRRAATLREELESRIVRLEFELKEAKECAPKRVGKAKLNARVEKLEKAMAHVLLGFEADL